MGYTCAYIRSKVVSNQRKCKGSALEHTHVIRMKELQAFDISLILHQKGLNTLCSVIIVKEDNEVAGSILRTSTILKMD
jgi:hypothetical protein